MMDEAYSLGRRMVALFLLYFIYKRGHGETGKHSS